MGRKHSSRLARALLALCLSTATLFAVAVGAGAAGGATSISGTVTGAGGAPLSGATVYLYSPITSEADGAVTDGSGHYLIDTLPAGDYFLSVTRAGYVTQYVDHLQLPADTPLTRDFVLTQLGSLHVTVTSVDSTPVTDAAVTANGPEGSYFATPTGVGEYTIADMNPGTYTVSIGAGTVGEGQVLPQSVLVTSGAPTELSVQLLEAGGVQGIIRGPDGLPLSSGNLSLSTGLPFAPSYSAFVLPGGSYNFSNIAPGTYTMKIQPGNAAVAPATLTVVIAPGIYQLRDITLDPAASLYVNVSSATPQNPLATPASVLCPAPGDPLVLNPFPTCPGGSVGSGARTFYGPLAAGTYNVVGAYDGGPPNYLPVATSAVEAVTLGPGEVAKCSLVIDGSNSCTVGAPVTLSGNVTDGSNPLASSGGFLVCDGTFTGIGFTPCDGGSVLRFQNSDNLGNVTVAGLPGGTFEVRAYKIGAGFSVTYAAPSTVTAVPGDTITCQGAVPGATTCSTGAPSDGDGVDEPAGLDGNGDGTPDAQQPDVTTLTPAVGTGPVTIDTGDPAYPLKNVTATGVPSGAPAVDFPVGVLGFEVTLPSGQTTADVTIHLPAGTNPTGYMKLVGNVWTPFTAITIDTSHTVSPHDLVTLHLTDNDGFDTNPAVGVIGDPGAPVVDHTGPTVVCGAAPTYLLRQPGTSVTADASDAGSGVASPTVTVAAPTTAVGSRSVAVTASDLAGNTTTVNCPYVVQFRFVGLAATVSESKTNVVKAGRSLELGWWLADYAYKPVSTTASFSGATTTPVACPAGATSTPLVTTTASGYQSLGLGLHLYSWKAPSSLVGQCAQVTVNLADGTSHSIVAKVK